MEKVRENVSGVRVLKSFAQEPGSERDFAKTNQRLVDENMSLVRVHGLFHPLIELLGGATMAIILWVGGASVIRGRVSLGDFVAFAQYLMMLVWPMLAVGQAVSLIQRGSASLQRINSLSGAAGGHRRARGRSPLAGRRSRSATSRSSTRDRRIARMRPRCPT